MRTGKFRGYFLELTKASLEFSLIILDFKMTNSSINTWWEIFNLILPLKLFYLDSSYSNWFMWIFSEFLEFIWMPFGILFESQDLKQFRKAYPFYSLPGPKPPESPFPSTAAPLLGRPNSFPTLFFFLPFLSAVGSRSYGPKCIPLHLLSDLIVALVSRSDGPDPFLFSLFPFCLESMPCGPRL